MGTEKIHTLFNFVVSPMSLLDFFNYSDETMEEDLKSNVTFWREPIERALSRTDLDLNQVILLVISDDISCSIV